MTGRFRNSASERHPFYTIGHSNRTIEAFIALIKAADVDMVVDVRTVPRSRAQPQFNMDALAHKLGEAGCQYKHVPALGGLRKRAGTAKELNAFWQNQSFHNYADYTLSDEFRSGLTSLREMGQRWVCAIMCAEAVWWRCHRRIISDYLIAAGETVFHILGPRSVEPAQLTRGAQVHSDGSITYPAEALIDKLAGDVPAAPDRGG